MYATLRRLAWTIRSCWGPFAVRFRHLLERAQVELRMRIHVRPDARAPGVAAVRAQADGHLALEHADDRVAILRGHALEDRQQAAPQRLVEVLAHEQAGGLEQRGQVGERIPRPTSCAVYDPRRGGAQ